MIDVKEKINLLNASSQRVIRKLKRGLSIRKTKPLKGHRPLKTSYSY